MTIMVKQGDTHDIQWKANIDLTGATVRLVAEPRGGEPIELAVTVVEAEEGLVSHTLTGTLLRGTYKVELEVTSDGKIITFPNNDYASLTVLPDLD